MRRFTRIDILVALIASVVFAVLLLQNSPIASDDMIYRFDQRCVDGAEEWTTPITSWGQLIASNAEGYMYGNGRFLVHCVAQLILSFGGYWILYVFSPILFALFILAGLYIVRRNTIRLKGDAVYFLALLITLVPLCASTMYGAVTMMINYMWSMVVYTLFAATYFHISDTNDKERPIYLNVLLLLLGLLCGSWQESYCLGIAGAIAIYHLIHIRQFKGSLAWLVIGFGIGAAILVFAPGNFARIENGQASFIGWMPFIKQCIQLCKHNLFVWLWVLLGLISVIIDYRKSKRLVFLSDNWLWFGCSAIALIFTLYTISQGMMQGLWQLMVLGLTDTIIVIRFLSHYCGEWMNAQAKFIIPVAALYLVAIMSTVIYYRSMVKHEKDAFDAAFVTQKPDTIYEGQLQYTLTQVVPSHPFLFEKICDIHWNFYTLNTMQRLSQYYTNAQETWGTDILPEPKDSILTRCVEENKIGNGVYRAPLGYMIVVCPSNRGGVLYVHTTSMYPMDKLKDKLRNRKTKDFEYPISGLKLVQEEDGTAYYIKYADWWTFNSKNIVGADIERLETK